MKQSINQALTKENENTELIFKSPQRGDLGGLNLHMKKVCKIFILIISASVFLVGCNDFLIVDSNRVTFEKDFQMKSPNDSVYGMVGIYSQLQKLADSYVLLGELRADLLDITEMSNKDLRDINNFEITENNAYANIKDYYAVVNSCNYLIQTIDTSAIIKGQKDMYRYYAAAKGIRAWTYMQIALNFGTAKYYEKPILTLADAAKEYPEYNIEQLANVLIPDLLPWKNVEAPATYSPGVSMTFPISFLLGDLYLWTNRYKEAATEYHDLMCNGYYTIDKDYSNTWNLVDSKFIDPRSYPNMSWQGSYRYNGGEAITSIACPTTYDQKFDLFNLNYNPYSSSYSSKIKPSSVAVKYWDNQTYFNTETNTAQGDLRKYSSIYPLYSNENSFSTSSVSDTTSYIVYKYLYNNPEVNKQYVVIYRSSLLYLRYAEAVNRLGKPNLAMAVLKNGMSAKTFNPPPTSRKLIPARERSSENYMNFTTNIIPTTLFDDNVGIRSRGCGPNIVNDSVSYIIPPEINDSAHVNDAVLYVEDLIQQELALETAFEGNRFHDLMRLAIRRGDYSYLAKKIAAKHVGNEAAIETKLTDPINWYIKK